MSESRKIFLKYFLKNAELGTEIAPQAVSKADDIHKNSGIII